MRVNDRRDKAVAGWKEKGRTFTGDPATFNEGFPHRVIDDLVQLTEVYRGRI